LSASTERIGSVDSGPRSLGGRAVRSKDRAWKLASLIAALGLVSIVAFAVTSSPHQKAVRFPAAPPVALAAGTPAPAFDLPSLDGGPRVALSAHRGTPVVVNFFASWCPHCRPELPELAAIAHQPGQAVDVLGVDSDDPNPSEARAMLASAQATYPVVVDPKAQVSTQYLLTGLPATYFVGRDGRVVGAAFGPLTAKQLAVWMARLTMSAPRQ
jgi:cytochrome c biogenesis protein CcmG, thiol:disulfide interchange protein DsbE